MESNATPRKEMSNIQKTRLIMLKALQLPVELIDVILDLAEFWTPVSTSREQDVDTLAGMHNNDNAECCYLISDPIQHLVQLRKVVITTNSNDQGWGGEPEHYGTYYASWSWFETTILNHRFQRKYEAFIEHADQNPIDIHDDADLVDGRINPKELKVDMGKRWHVQRNVQVSRDRKEHIVAWSTFDAFGGEEDEDEDYTTGSGLGAGFLQSLQEGDRIGIIARALYPGWCNHVHSVKIDVYYWIP